MWEKKVALTPANSVESKSLESAQCDGGFGG